MSWSRPGNGATTGASRPTASGGRGSPRGQRDLGVNLAGAALALDLHSTWIQQSKAMNHSRWLNRLPVQTIEDDPELLMLKAWHLQNHGHYPEA